MKTQVTIKLDPAIKRGAQKRAKELGLTLSSVVNATLSQFARTGELHVDVSYTPTPYLKRVIREAEQEYAEGKASPAFNTVDDLMASLDA
jgi:addiction module RelB/DinJ family antitoxin